MLRKEILIILLGFACASIGFAQEAAKAEAAKPETPKAEPVKKTEKIIKFKIELPDDAKIGTPTPVVLPNFEKNMKNPPLEVPEDVKNIALKKPVTSSDDFPLVGELHQVTDGDKAAASYVEIGGDSQWVQIDLQKTSEIFAIMMWFHQGYKAYKDIVVQLSDDAAFKKDVVTVFNNDHDNSSKLGIGKDKTWEESHEGKLVKLEKPLKARYVRVYSNGNTLNELNAYTEVEVYGR